MSVESTLAERGSRYGDFSIHAEIAQNLQDEMRSTKGWSQLSPTQKQALTVIADKIARILSGDPNYDDNWHDIQGYAKLVEDRLVDVSQDPAETVLDAIKEAPHFTESIKVPLGNNCLVCNEPGGHSGIGCPKMRATAVDYTYTQ